MKTKRFLKIFIPIITLTIVAAIIIFIHYYNKIYSDNIDLGASEGKYLYIHSGDDFDDVCYTLGDFLLDQNSFLWLAEKKNFRNHVYPGRYLITSGMCNNDLINMFRSGNQYPLKLIINNIRTKAELAGLVSGYIETDSATIINLLNNEEYLDQYDLNSEDVMVVFIPNTYEFFWNTSAEKFLERMISEKDKFWTDERLNKAGAIPLNSKEVSILASIVQQETKHKDEMDEVAGVYINRLKRGMLLQADPTVVFALGDFTKMRVLKEDTKTDSPYNTYKYSGLPPGPICLPEPATIDKVLNYKEHNYFYMCAKEDLSGKHNFSSSLRQHLSYARKYQRALNKLKIRK